MDTERRLVTFDAMSLPGDTGFRFALLVVAILSGTLFVFNLLHNSIPSLVRAQLAAYRTCLAMPSPDFTPSLANPLEDPGAQVRLSEAFSDCYARAERSRVAVMLLGVAVVALASLALLFAAPRWKLRRAGFVPIDPEDAPELVRELDQLLRTAGVRHPVTFVWNPFDQSLGAVAFGHFGRYYVGLYGGLVVRQHTDPPMFQAVVLHELAHVQNADINKTYLTVCGTYVFLVLAVPALLFTLQRDSVAVMGDVAVRTLALISLVVVSRNAVLHTREVYADARAARSGPVHDALARSLAAMPSHHGRWPALLSRHPRPTDRRRALEHGIESFQIGGWAAAGAGLASGMAYPRVLNVIASAVASVHQASLAPGIAALLFSALIVGVLGTATWRSVVTAPSIGHGNSRPGRLALGFGSGMLIGRFLAFDSSASLRASGASDVAYFAGLAAWACVLTLMLYGFLRWVISATECWCADGPPARPALVYGVGLALSVGIFTTGLGPLFMADELLAVAASVRDATAPGMGVAGMVTSVWSLIPPGLLFAASVALWAFPLSAGSRSLTFKSDPTPELFDRRRALRVTLTVGAVYTALLLAVRLLLRATVPEEQLNADATRVTFFFGQIAAAALCCTLAALIMAMRARLVPSLQALATAFGLALVLTLVIQGMNLAFGGTTTPRFLWLTLSLISNPAAAAVIALAPAAAYVARTRR